jgi:hypothetical protein
MVLMNLIKIPFDYGAPDAAYVSTTAVNNLPTARVLGV